MKKKILASVLGVFLSVSLMMSSVPASASVSNASQAMEVKTEEKVAAGTVTYSVDASGYEKGKEVRLWLPVGHTDDFQTVGDVKFEAEGSAATELNTDELGNVILYVEWNNETEPSDRKVTCSFHAERKEVLRPELREEGTFGEELNKYLKPSAMVAIDGKTKELADEITEGKTTTLEKARAIYDWVIANMNRDENVIGCGNGDVERLLEVKEGKCTDINSVFVALCKASGIPARETFGIRMNADDITKNQHCWSQFYLPGTGWVFADPADVLKAVLKNNWSKESKEAKDLQEYYWGSVDEKRVELSEGRDLFLTPKQNGEALNNFGYPYMEVDGTPVDYYQPDTFKYTISFKADQQ